MQREHTDDGAGLRLLSHDGSGPGRALAREALVYLIGALLVAAVAYLIYDFASPSATLNAGATKASTVTQTKDPSKPAEAHLRLVLPSLAPLPPLRTHPSPLKGGSEPKGVAVPKPMPEEGGTVKVSPPSPPEKRSTKAETPASEEPSLPPEGSVR